MLGFVNPRWEFPYTQVCRLEETLGFSGEVHLLHDKGVFVREELLESSASNGICRYYTGMNKVFTYLKEIHIMAHQPPGGKPVAAASPNVHRPGPLYNPEASLKSTILFSNM